MIARNPSVSNKACPSINIVDLPVRGWDLGSCMSVYIYARWRWSNLLLCVNLIFLVHRRLRLYDSNYDSMEDPKKLCVISLSFVRPVEESFEKPSKLRCALWPIYHSHLLWVHMLSHQILLSQDRHRQSMTIALRLPWHLQRLSRQADVSNIESKIGSCFYY